MVIVDNLVKTYGDFRLELSMEIKDGAVTGIVGRFFAEGMKEDSVYLASRFDAMMNHSLQGAALAIMDMEETAQD